MKHIINLTVLLSFFLSTIASAALTPPLDPVGRESAAATLYRELGSTPATPASGKRKIYPKSDGFYQLDSTGAETKVGSGSGGGGVNYILNPDAESGTTGYATYADAAGVTPVDGTGGSPTATWTRTTSSPLRGTGSFLLTKGATNRQGDGASYDFTIDAADQAKLLTLTFDYSIASGTYADSDVQIFIYDKTNSALIYAGQGQSLLNHTFASAPGKVIFQSASNSVSYRVIFHISSTSASAYTLKFDNFILGPQSVTTGPPATDWVNYVPVFTGFGTVSGVSIQSRRNGPNLEVRGTVTVGTPTAVAASMQLGYNGVSGNVNVDTAVANTTRAYGRAIRSASGAQEMSILGGGASTNLAFFSLIATASTVALGGLNGSSIIGAGETISIDMVVPILGWSSNQILGQDSSTRKIVAVYYDAVGSAGSTTQPWNFNTKVEDTTNSVTTGSAWKFTAPETDYYDVNLVGVSATTGNSVTVYKNGVTTGYSFAAMSAAQVQGGATTLYLKAGEYIDIRPNASVTLIGDPSIRLTIKRSTSGSQQIAATETVGAFYNGTPTGTLSAAYNLLTFPNKVRDSNNAYASGVYTVPANGTYSIEASVDITGTFAISNYNAIAIQLNGTTIGEDFRYVPASSPSTMPRVVILNYPLLAGQLITVKSYSAASGPSFGGGASNFSITRTGSY